jgi:hypothetical protein
MIIVRREIVGARSMPSPRCGQAYRLRFASADPTSSLAQSKRSAIADSQAKGAGVAQVMRLLRRQDRRRALWYRS